MDIQRFKYFEALFRHRKFVSAAEELKISQPALSKQIKKLEQDLGFQLFERTTRELTPTESGMTLYKYVSKLLRDYHNLLKEIEEIKHTGSGMIHIGMVESTKKWIPQIIKKFNLEYPNIQFKLTEMNAIGVEKSLLNYDIHFGFTTRQSKEDSLNFLKIYQEDLILITSVDHPFNEYRSIDFIDLKGENIIQFKSEYQLKEAINKAHQMAGFGPKGKYEVEKLETARSIVEANLAVAILPENYLKYTSLKNIHLVYLKNPTPSRNIYLALNKQRSFTPAITRFISLVKEFFEINKE